MKNVARLLPSALALCILAVLPGLSLAQETYTGEADVSFDGKSNLHGFSGTVNNVPLKVQVTGSEGAEKLSMSTTVTIKNLTTDNNKRDKEMWKMFGYGDHPLMTVKVSGAPLDTAYPSGNKPGKLPVTLVVQGKTTQVTGTTHNLKETAKGGSFELRMDLSLEDMGLKAPQTLLLKVRDEVKVSAQITLTKL